MKVIEPTTQKKSNLARSPLTIEFETSIRLHSTLANSECCISGCSTASRTKKELKK